MTHHDSYRGVAAHYDLHGWDWYAKVYGARLIALLRERGIAPPASILDAGCGTGFCFVGREPCDGTPFTTRVSQYARFSSTPTP